MDARKISIVRAATPRKDVRVTLVHGGILAAPIGTSIETLLLADQQRQPERYASPIMGAICNGKLRELAYSIRHDSTLEPVLLSSSDGGRIYRRSLVLLLATAAAELWHDCDVSVRYAVPDGGFYCTTLNRPPFNDDDLARLEAHMHAIVAANEPIHKRTVPLDEARELFRLRGETDKLRLMEQRTRPSLVLYTLRGRSDYYYGYMLPSTGYLSTFRLVNSGKGFILQYPRRESPGELFPIRAVDKLSLVFQEADEWLKRLGVEDAGRMNRLVITNQIQELILVAEALHEQKIARAAGEIMQRHQDGVRVVMIAGPSSAGKTTFSKRLAIQLLAHGIRPFTLELDNYFVDRERTPRDENGDYDFESLAAINLNLFNQQLVQLVRGERVELPRFDFYTGKSSNGREAQLKAGQVIIIEGIHGLNPALVTDLPPESLYRIYVSALTQLNLDAHNRVPTTDVRLLRRIVRDANTRGYNATDTLGRWGSVRRGEKRNIFPYQDNADFMFNSALTYELAALRPLVEPLLLQVSPGSPAYIESNRLLSFLSWVQPLTPAQAEIIPDTSILREFIGKSSLENYHPADFYKELE